MDSKKIYLFFSIVIAIVVVGLLVVFYTGGQKPDQTNSGESGDVAGATTQDSSQDKEWIEGLAKKLTEKGVVMYGAYWCSHCNNQKKMFGDAVKYIDYVECDPSGEGANPDECKANEIEGYPTWIYEGTKYPGEMSLEKLAQIVGYK
ncbi:MAG: hypothetical protein BWY19_00848 [bacterium ADurb.Bin212]|nr:MAG: hypothetical protein BWY19_00848 [bacterium ADurb.Bin212]